MYMDSWWGCQHYISVDTSHSPDVTPTAPLLVSSPCIFVPLTKAMEM